MFDHSNIVHLLRKKSQTAPEMLMSSGFCVSFLNPYSYLIARKHPQIFNKLDVIYVDGISLVLLLNILGIKAKRYSFDMTSLARKLFQHCEEKGKTIYFLGSKEEEIALSTAQFSKEFPNMKILGFRNGYFQSETQKNEAQSEILKINPDYMIVGMGTPLQEKFILELKELGYGGTAFTCGGFLHQSSKGVDYYPKWIDRFNLRWLYRMYDEPKLIKRYAIDYPRSFFTVLYDFFR